MHLLEVDELAHAFTGKNVMTPAYPRQMESKGAGKSLQGCVNLPQVSDLLNLLNLLISSLSAYLGQINFLTVFRGYTHPASQGLNLCIVLNNMLQFIARDIPHRRNRCGKLYFGVGRGKEPVAGNGAFVACLGNTHDFTMILFFRIKCRKSKSGNVGGVVALSLNTH